MRKTEKKRDGYQMSVAEVFPLDSITEFVQCKHKEYLLVSMLLPIPIFIAQTVSHPRS